MVCSEGLRSSCTSDPIEGKLERRRDRKGKGENAWFGRKYGEKKVRGVAFGIKQLL